MSTRVFTYSFPTTNVRGRVSTLVNRAKCRDIISKICCDLTRMDWPTISSHSVRDEINSITVRISTLLQSKIPSRTILSSGIDELDLEESIKKQVGSLENNSTNADTTVCGKHSAISLSSRYSSWNKIIVFGWTSMWELYVVTILPLFRDCH